MAYQTRTRDPLLDPEMRDMMVRRAQEFIGLGLFALALILAAILWSHDPADSGLFNTADGPTRNWLGPVGASLASLLTTIIGQGAWSLVVLFGLWGVRMITHIGAERAASRMIFGPIWMAVCAVFAATLATTSAWGYSFGLGGMFGDVVLGALLNIVPIGSEASVRLLSVVLAAAMLASGAFVLGFIWREGQGLIAMMALGLVKVHAFVTLLIGQAQTSTAQRRSKAPAQSADVRETPNASGLFARLQPRDTGTDQTNMIDVDADDRTTEPDRLTDRIRKAVQFRQNGQAPGDQKAQAGDTSADRPLTRGRGFGPQPIILSGAVPEMEAEPPLHAKPDAPASFLRAPAVPNDQAALIDDGELNLAGGAAERRIPQAAPTPLVSAPTPAAGLAPSRQAKAEAQPKLQFEQAPKREWDYPPLALLSDPSMVERVKVSEDALAANARMLENVLDDYGVKGEIVSVRPGPVVTMYELEPAPGLKASRVIGLADDIARSMSALSARVSTVPGRSVIGIELPNEKRETVLLREMLAAKAFGENPAKLPLALGKDIGGVPMVANLAKMPHLLIAGTTGSGKSVAINTMILSLLYRLSPDECRMIMIDPKMLELSIYDGIPHLLSPVVTDPKKAVVALKWVVAEMEERYRKMSKMGVRNIDGYNGRVEDAQGKGEMFVRTVQTGFDDESGEPVFETEEFAPEKMPYIVVIVDEMADLMMVAGKEIEACIQRLAQMARASGIHLIMATQRPSVDVITGTIKANFPTRISFQVTSKIDSRTILGEMGAEQLLGQGDMLYMAGGGRVSRCHGPFVSDEEVEEVVRHLKAWGPPEYVGDVQDGPSEEKESAIDQVLGLGGNTNGEDALYDQAVAIAARDRKCSTSYIQRKLGIGYNKAARLVEQMEEEGVVSQANHVGKREVLIPEA